MKTESQTDTNILNEEALKEIEARANAATAGPWVYFGEPPDNVFWGEIRSAAEDGHFAHITDTPELDERDNDMEFIAHAREDVPKLIATIRSLRAENEVYKAADYSALTSDVDKLRSRILEAVKAKADEWRQLSHAEEDDAKSNDLYEQCCAAREIAEMIERMK